MCRRRYSMNKQLISFETDVVLREQLQKLAKEREMSVSGLIRFILKQYLNNHCD